jgi:hypothetical protein
MHPLTQRSRSLPLPKTRPLADANSHNLRVGLAIGVGGSFQEGDAMLTGSTDAVRICKVCVTEKPESEFYHYKGRGGKIRTMGKCKECVKTAVKRRYYSEPEKIRSYERYRYKLPHRKALAKKIGRRWRSMNGDRARKIAKAWRDRNKARHLSYRKKDPIKYAARCAVGNAVRDGKLKKQPCEVCGSTIRIHAHHDDYTKPLEVRWLCPKHHALVHHPEVAA